MSRHWKREVAPGFWPIPRKRFVWAIKPAPGPHRADESLPLASIVRDVLKLAKTRREAKTIIGRGEVRVDGRIIREDRYPVGLMDVLEIPAIKEAYRILPSRKGLGLAKIPAEEANVKLCKISGKTTTRGGHLQLNLHDGRSILVRIRDPRNPVEDVFKVGDSLLVSLPDQKILNHVRMEKGVLALAVKGGSMGRIGRVVEIRRGTMLSPRRIVLEDRQGSFETLYEYVFPIGTEKPLITLAA